MQAPARFIAPELSRLRLRPPKSGRGTDNHRSSKSHSAHSDTGSQGVVHRPGPRHMTRSRNERSGVMSHSIRRLPVSKALELAWRPPRRFKPWWERLILLIVITLAYTRLRA